METQELERVIAPKDNIYNSYREELNKIENPLYKEEINFFLTNHIERLRSLIGHSRKIFEFLKIIALSYGDLIENSIYNSITSSTIRITSINNSRSYEYPIGEVKIAPVNFLGYKSSRAPYCCGWTEYGEFNFKEYRKEDKELVFNLIIDLIRLSANECRSTHSGAVGMINYFVGTDFTRILENRDDLNFIKQFKNPKTNATLKCFIFDTLI